MQNNHRPPRTGVEVFENTAIMETVHVVNLTIMVNGGGIGARSWVLMSTRLLIVQSPSVSKSLLGLEGNKTNKKS